ncbi:hypothetical protein ACHQM5_027483 [Ranunculus cassubicifolius]
MALKMIEISLVTILIAILRTGVAAQSTSCTNVLISMCMSPCQNYITGNSSSPYSSCMLNGGGSQLGLNINQTQALQLPSACNVQTPPVSQCNAAAAALADTPTVSLVHQIPHHTNAREAKLGIHNNIIMTHVQVCERDRTNSSNRSHTSSAAALSWCLLFLLICMIEEH